ncbi:MAG: hypothetical protein HGB26_00260 [Desulfobulbaceae bacterium]|nr:hypothetical protein [Desulfobulbaceae bacterium]
MEYNVEPALIAFAGFLFGKMENAGGNQPVKPGKEKEAPRQRSENPNQEG